MKTTKNAAIAASILLAVAMGAALTGIVPVKYHQDCIDGIDDDGNGDIDGEDPDCAEYPYADGNGEENTPNPQRTYDGVSTSYESLSGYYIEHSTLTSTIETNICFALSANLLNQPDLVIAQDYVADNTVNCGIVGP